jgi:hypothetical protein
MPYSPDWSSTIPWYPYPSIVTTGGYTNMQASYPQSTAPEPLKPEPTVIGWLKERVSEITELAWA